MYKFFSILDISYFGDEVFSKREAFRWLLSHAINGKVLCSIRQMTSIWRWHKSKVERFLSKLKSESLIETEIKSGKLLISISNIELFEALPSNLEAHSKTVWRQNRDIIEDNIKLQNSEPEQKAETISRQNRDSNASANHERDNAEDSLSQRSSGLEQKAETISGQNQDNKEEKKKRSKKRKEERFFKEKNIPFGDIKKEMQENVFVPFSLVKESDVEHWVTEKIKVPVNITWELDKFKDYWLSTRKKPPKDGIAAFRNWLRRSIEIYNKYGGKSEQFNRTSRASINREPTGFERFLTGGLRAVDKLG